MRCSAILAAVLALLAAPGALAQGLGDALTGGKWWADLRYRYEHVDQNNTLRNADASTLRVRAGYETGRYYGLGVLLEAEGTGVIGGELYNSTVNGKTQYSVVADPEAAEINQAYLSYAGVPATMLKYGRQRITLDNQRFIGNVGWRQNEQTFDAFTAVNESLPHTRVTLGYLYNVNRVFTDKSTQGNAKMSSPVLNVSYKGFGIAELTGYAYLLDYANAPASSAQTWGLRFKGDWSFSEKLKSRYALEYAVQRDYADNPASFNVRYYTLEGALSLASPAPMDFRLAYEVLGSNGAVSFQTPLATLHAFNGWADLFLTTPPQGLRDAFAAAGVTLSGVKLEAIYHDFRADRAGGRYGTEWDFQATLPFAKRYLAGVKYADYNAQGFSVDTRKLWLWVEAKF